MYVCVTMAKTIFPDKLDIRLVITGENVPIIREALDGIKKRHCSKQYNSAIEFVIMEYIEMTTNTTKTTKK